jgi:hypothetical protein
MACAIINDCPARHAVLDSYADDLAYRMQMHESSGRLNRLMGQHIGCVEYRPINQNFRTCFVAQLLIDMLMGWEHGEGSGARFGWIRLAACA